MTENLKMKARMTGEGRLEMFLAAEPVPETLDENEVLIEVDAAPINPSDQGVMFGPANIAEAVNEDRDGRALLTAPIPEALLARVSARLGKALPVGNEGAGTVVAAGSGAAAQALLGKTVAAMGGAMYARYCKTTAENCLAFNEGTTAVEGASSFVNPLTALSMVETMRMEGHSALVHTAAASNLGQMLNRICQADDVSLVNIVRSEDQAKILRSAGANHVCNSSDDDFLDQLTEAVAETNATLAFDAVGGGKLANYILMAMERAQGRKADAFSVYGSTAHKQVYLYGSLDLSPTVLTRGYGMFWGVGGWLLPPFLARIGGKRAGELRQRVADEIGTTFASHYTKEISLEDALQADVARAYARKATGEKYLIRPQR
ncbi:zinc-binding dehydrogenase [Pacificimonas flava]|uniref:NADH oxidoreductase n=1 Tax=Pacificimonas flava TaxID=1234595 RepID=M2U8Z5_9SPHN|nr:zinc-binding dehydrogenase [Pacificimonas flava]EMD84422.1 NADH oxidoreductase [Pacificimonas flava]MBB5279706.1 NADPH:quinone reductase-like Zn-dependent oxidoreductase [Pacificimonas flava]